MKSIKRIALLALLAPLALIACDDDPKKDVVPDETQNKYFSIELNEIHAAKTGGSYSINYKATEQPALTSTPDWLECEIEPSTDSTGVLNVTIAEYNVKNEVTDYDSRTASLVLSACGEIQTITINQAPDNLLLPDEAVRINSVDQEYPTDYEGLTDYKVKFKTNGEFSVDAPWWIYIKDTPERQLVEGSKSQYIVEVNVAVLSNYSDEVRVDSITFSLGDKSFACKFRQEETKWEFTGVQRPAFEVAQDIKMGWNLTDACLSDADVTYYTDALSSWMVDSVAQYNINAIRIPVLPYDTINTEINQFWINNVESIAKSIVSKGQYAVITISDNGWLLRKAANSDTTSLYNLFVNTWHEIATLFDQNDDHVIFECYDNFNSSYTSIMNRLDELFVQTVRRSGKNNYKRCLILPFDANSQATIQMPKNEVTPDRLLLSCKTFKPEDYASEAANYKLWGAPFKTSNEEWSPYTEDMLKTYFSNLHAKLNNEARGIPAIISEFGAITHGAEPLYASSEAFYVNTFVLAAKNEGFTTFVWDDNNTGVGHFGVFNRKDKDAFTVRHQYAQALAQAALNQSLTTDEEEETEQNESL